jgi:DNA-binding transcriptional LysR family regulator
MRVTLASWPYATKNTPVPDSSARLAWEIAARGKALSFEMSSPSRRKYGTPRALDDLDEHLVVHYSIRFGTDTPGFEYRDGNIYRERPMRSLITVNSTDSYRATCLAGLGIIQSPRMGLLPSVTAGELVEILPQHTCQPLPVSLVRAHGRNVPRHVRVVMSWVGEILKGQLD